MNFHNPTLHNGATGEPKLWTVCHVSEPTRFSLPMPLYWFCSPCGYLEGYVRAGNLADAKRTIEARVAFLGPIAFRR